MATQQKALDDLFDLARPKGNHLLVVNEPSTYPVKIKSWIKEFFTTAPKTTISDPTSSFLFGDTRLTRQQVKHIVEQRVAEGKTAKEVSSMMERLPEVVQYPTLEYPNNSLKYPNSFRRARFYPELNKGIVVILDNKTGEIHDVITAFSNRPGTFRKLEARYKK